MIIIQSCSNLYEGEITFYQRYSSPLCPVWMSSMSSMSSCSMFSMSSCSMDQGKFFGALLTDLSKAFDCLPHDLLAAKLSAYGFDKNSTMFLFDYLTNRKQRTKIGQVYSSWSDITSGVPQGSILGPLIFNIDICDMFYILDNYGIASYADDTTRYIASETIDSLTASLERIAEAIFKWFKDNEMQGNTDKCHILEALTKNCM